MAGRCCVAHPVVGYRVLRIIRGQGSQHGDWVSKGACGAVRPQGDPCFVCTSLWPASFPPPAGVTPVIGLDCEMVGVGPEGARSSLARVAVINVHGNVLLDVHVQQKERVTDYRWARVWASTTARHRAAARAPVAGSCRCFGVTSGPPISARLCTLPDRLHAWMCGAFMHNAGHGPPQPPASKVLVLQCALLRPWMLPPPSQSILAAPRAKHCCACPLQSWTTVTRRGFHTGWHSALAPCRSHLTQQPPPPPLPAPTMQDQVQRRAPG